MSYCAMMPWSLTFPPVVVAPVETNTDTSTDEPTQLGRLLIVKYHWSVFASLNVPAGTIDVEPIVVKLAVAFDGCISATGQNVRTSVLESGAADHAVPSNVHTVPLTSVCVSFADGASGKLIGTSAHFLQEDAEYVDRVRIGVVH